MPSLADAVKAARRPGIRPFTMPDPETDHLVAALREMLPSLVIAWTADAPEAPTVSEFGLHVPIPLESTLRDESHVEAEDSYVVELRAWLLRALYRGGDDA